MNQIGDNPDLTKHLQERMRSIKTIKSLRELLNSADQINPNDRVDDDINKWEQDFGLNQNMTSLIEANRVGHAVSNYNNAIEEYHSMEALYQRQLRFVTRLTDELLPSIQEAYQTYTHRSRT